MKYELSDDSIGFRNRRLFRIRALRDVGESVKAGELGGYVESLHNLSQGGSSWIGRYAKAIGSARVMDDANVRGEAVVSGSSKVSGHARVEGRAQVYERAFVCGNAVVSEYAKVCGDACVSSRAAVEGNAIVEGSAIVCDNAIVSGNAKVCENAVVSGCSSVFDHAIVSGDARVSGRANVGGCSKISEVAFVDSDAEIFRDADIRSRADYMVFKNTWSSFRWFTCFRRECGELLWIAGCFKGTGDELVEKAYKDSKLSGDCYKAIVDAANKIMAVNSGAGLKVMKGA